MTRRYTCRYLVVLPRLTANTTHALITQVLTVASEQQQQLEASGQPLPTLICRSLTRLRARYQNLAIALGPELASSSTGETRAADQAIDNAWGGFHNFLVGWSRVPAEFSPDPAGIAALLQLLFADGLSFLTLDYRTEWSQSQTRIDALGQRPYLDTVTRLGATSMLEALKKAQADYGKALGLTASTPVEPPAELRATRDAALDALREYVVKVLAWADPEEAGSEALSEALLAPLEAWVSPEGSSEASSGADAEKSATAADAEKSATAAGAETPIVDA